jgi:hypothetical protein
MINGGLGIAVSCWTITAYLDASKHPDGSGQALNVRVEAGLLDGL